MKRFLLVLAVVLSVGFAYASTSKVDTTVKNAIYKYKTGNYTGCIQDLTDYVEQKPSAIAYYYLGMSYTQAGFTEKASTYYALAIQLAEIENNLTLKKYAEIGKKKVDTPEKFEDLNSYDNIRMLLEEEDDIPLDLKNDLRKKHLEYLRNEMNSSKNPHF